jgi:hypothetical protein
MAMTEQHKAALAEGRRQARAIRAYLEALETRRPGRPVTEESLAARLDRIDARLSQESDVLRRLDLLQQRNDVVATKEALAAAVDFDELERGFVESSAGYGTRKGIGYAAWRAVGVPASVLKRAGIRQTRNRRSGTAD